MPATVSRPFTMEAPYVAFEGELFPVVFVGDVGTEYWLEILDLDANTQYAELHGSITGVNGPGEVHWITPGSWGSILRESEHGQKHCQYKLRIKRPGEAPKNVVLLRSGQEAGPGNLCYLIVYPAEAHEKGAFFDVPGITAATQVSYENPLVMNYGLSEY